MDGMRIFTLLIAISVFSSLHAQSVDVSGRWAGTATWLKAALQVEYELTQEGLTIEGYETIHNLNGKDSARMKLKGVIHGSRIRLNGYEFVYKTGSACLSVKELELKRDGSGERLVGRWRGDMKLSTCPPAVGGKVEVAKVSEPQPLTIAAADRSSAPAESQRVHADDFEGNELVKELSNRRYYALIIGIDNYKDPGIVALDRPVADSRSLANILTTHYAFDKQDVTVLENPTRSTIIESFDALSEKIQPQDQLLVFYAGHGIWDEQLNQGFWLPSDASMKSKAQWLSNSTIRDYIGGIRSKHTLLITDACFSGGIFKERGVFGNSKAMLEMYKLPSRKAMTSGALKTVPDKSVFIEYLTKNLVNNTQPLLSAEELFGRFKVAVINNSPNGQVPQYAPITQTGDEGGDFIFLKRLE